MAVRQSIVVALMLFVASCYRTNVPNPVVPNSVFPKSGTPTSTLPNPHANNAVAAARDADGVLSFYSFNGLTAGKTWNATSHNAFACKADESGCREIVPVPVDDGRLASVAVTLRNKVFLFGGYTVAEDNSEISTPEVFAFDPVSENYTRVSDMPTPVDDMVAFSYLDRYIYLVSGWHNDGNVSLVQVYDVEEDAWFSATDYPGAPVFGHAGGAVGNKFLIADGVAVIGVKEGRRQFGAVDEIWLGEIDPSNPAEISWQSLPAHPGVPLYRMAAGGDENANRIVFVGGGDNPYNYTGIGYDGVPSKPSDKIFAFDLTAETWIDLGTHDRATMDHRGLLFRDGAVCTLGGLDEALAVIGDLVCRDGMQIQN